jgi:hypothetical protein
MRKHVTHFDDFTPFIALLVTCVSIALLWAVDDLVK